MISPLPPACLGPSGEPVEVSVGPLGGWGLLSALRLTDGVRVGLEFPGKAQDPHVQPWGRRLPSQGTLPGFHSVQGPLLPPRPSWASAAPAPLETPLQAPSRPALQPWPWAPLSLPDSSATRSADCQECTCEGGTQTMRAAGPGPAPGPACLKARPSACA